MTGNYGERRLTGAVFLSVAKACDTVWISGLLYKLTILNSPPYLFKSISYLQSRPFEAFFQSATSFSLGWCRWGLSSPVLFSVYVYGNDVASLSHHVELAPLMNCLKAYLSDQERHLTMEDRHRYLERHSGDFRMGRQDSLSGGDRR